jgi:hypothetical protein
MKSLIRNYKLELIFFSFLFFIFLHTGATTITSEDSASFHLALITLGINHPPGYPLYTILGHIFVNVFSFLTSKSHLVNLFSAFWAFLALVNLHGLLRILKINKFISLVATTAAAFSFGLWSQANVAEVYSLNVFLSILAITIFYKFKCHLDLSKDHISKKTDLYAWLFSFISGLGLSHHYPLYILTILPLVLFYLILIPNSKLKIFINRKPFIYNILFLLLGLSPYLYIFIRALLTNPEYVFGNLYTFSDVLSHIKRDSYSVVDFQTSDISVKFHYLIHSLKLIIKNLRYFSIIAIIGLIYSFKNKSSFLKALMFSSAGTILLLPFILAFPKSELFLEVYRVYPIPGFFLLTIFIAYGFKIIFEKLDIKYHKVIYLIIICFCVEQFYSNYQLSSRYGDESDLVSSKTYLNSLPKDARLIAAGDQAMSLYYVQQILGLRKDLEIVSFQNTYTKTKILSKNNYQRVKASPSDAIRLRTKSIMKYAQELRPLISISEEPFKAIKVPFQNRIYGFSASRKGVDLKYPKDFDKKYYSIEHMSKIIPAFPKNDYWSNKRVFNMIPPLLTMYALHGNDAYELYIKLKNSPRGLARPDIFDSNKPRKILERLSVLLFKFKKIDQAIKVFKVLRRETTDNFIQFGLKFNYCKSLLDTNRIKEDFPYCDKVRLELSRRMQKQGQRSKR